MTVKVWKERKEDMGDRKAEDMVNFIRAAAGVIPSKRQLDWFDVGFYAFIHFGVNTFTDREWGDGTEPESIFCPKSLDCRQWARTLRDAGMKGMVLTAKHHDGFCLWPSRYTEHSVKNSPCKRDVVGEAAEACREAGIGFGVYLSPWDRNCACYGTPEYNDYYCNQLEELLTGYGKLFCVWFDGACGEGPDGRKQKYDFPRYVELIRRYQPDAAVFGGPDVRWCGNEAGSSRISEWAVTPGEICPLARVQTGPGPLAEEGSLAWLHPTDKSLGSMSNILYSKGLVFLPAEVDTSIRPGWFWHEGEEPKPLKKLFEIYVGSVGGNACLNLNIPPNRDGLLDERDVTRLREFRRLLDTEFANPLDIAVEKKEGGYSTQPEYRIKLEKPIEKGKLKYVELREDLTKGQRVESFRIEAMFPDGNQFPLFQGTTIGNRKICTLTDPFAEQNRMLDESGNKIDRLLVKITAARDEVFLKEIKLY